MPDQPEAPERKISLPERSAVLATVLLVAASQGLRFYGFSIEHVNPQVGDTLKTIGTFLPPIFAFVLLTIDSFRYTRQILSKEESEKQIKQVDQIKQDLVNSLTFAAGAVLHITINHIAPK